MVVRYTNENFAGTKLGNLTAMRFSHRVRNSIAHWIFSCDCGVEKTIELSSVLRGRATSCGCQSRYLISQKNNKHGHVNLVLFIFCKFFLNVPKYFPMRPTLYTIRPIHRYTRTATNTTTL